LPLALKRFLRIITSSSILPIKSTGNNRSKWRNLSWKNWHLQLLSSRFSLIWIPVTARGPWMVVETLFRCRSKLLWALNRINQEDLN
jgi:hypothetical protein